MSRSHHLFLATLLISAACRAAPERAPAIPPAALPRVSLGAVLDDIRERCKINVLAKDGLRRKEVTWTRPEGEFASLYWRRDLYGVGDQVFADVWPLGERTFALLPRQPITMEFDDADASILLDLVVRRGPGSFMATWPDTGNLALNVKDEPFRRLVEYIAHHENLLILRERGFIYRISSPEHERLLSTRPLPTATLNALGLGFSGRDHEGTISIYSTEVDASLLLGQISVIAGIPITIEEELDRPITLSLKEAPWREAVEAIALETQGVIWDEGDGKIAIRDMHRLTAEFVGADIAVVLNLLARLSGVRLEVAESLRAGCGMYIQNVCWRDAVFSLSRKIPFHLRVKPDGTLVAEPF